jgi:hypothetical protein
MFTANDRHKSSQAIPQFSTGPSSPTTFTNEILSASEVAIKQRFEVPS